MKIKAAVVYEQSGTFTIEELELSEPNDDEVLVRTRRGGSCGKSWKSGYQGKIWRSCSNNLGLLRCMPIVPVGYGSLLFELLSV